MLELLVALTLAVVAVVALPETTEHIAEVRVALVL
jgi:Tfp pilus assembly protein FimT